MKKLGFALAAVAAMTLGASTLFACGAAAKADASAKDPKGMACCAKGKNASAAATKDGKACCASHAAAAKDGKTCDSHAANHAAGKDGKSCAGHASADKAVSTCPMKGDMKKSEVAMTGKVLCEHCNLKRKESCSPVFQAEGSSEYLPLCPDGDVTGAKKASNEGTATLDVKGFLCEGKGGEKMLMVSSFTVKS